MRPDKAMKSNSEFLKINKSTNIDLVDLDEKYNFMKENNMNGIYLLTGRSCNGIKCMPLIIKSKNVYAFDFVAQSCDDIMQIINHHLFRFW